MITFKNVTKTYEINTNNIIQAVENIDITFKEGEVILLKGASGSGKSSILSLIAALSKPTSGEVIVDSKKISKLSDNFASIYRRDNIGFIFQKYNLIPTLSVKDNILLPLVPLNLKADDVEIKLNTVMQKFSIFHKKDIIVKNLSGGEQQRVAIARSYINEPKIILADEPTANLDKKLSEKFIEIMKELKEMNKTIIIATHDPLFFGLEFIDREIEMSDGKIIV